MRSSEKRWGVGPVRESIPQRPPRPLRENSSSEAVNCKVSTVRLYGAIFEFRLSSFLLLSAFCFLLSAFCFLLCLPFSIFTFPFSAPTSATMASFRLAQGRDASLPAASRPSSRRSLLNSPAKHIGLIGL